jgi:predicted nucleic acid-binding protein
MYFLGSASGWHGQQGLWRLVEQGVLKIHELKSSDMPRMMNLMEKYADIPMDLADSSLVLAAESLGVNRVFTLDSDFRVYRINGTQVFDLLP